MPEEIEQGLYIASLGMGIVFLSLVILLVIVLLLRMLFPGPDPTAIDNPEGQDGIQSIQGDFNSSNKNKLHPLGKIGSGTNTQEVAAIAVSLYLTLEQELDIDNHNSDKTQNVSSPSKWRNQGRSALMAGHGHRPSPFSKRQDHK